MAGTAFYTVEPLSAGSVFDDLVGDPVPAAVRIVYDRLPPLFRTALHSFSAADCIDSRFVLCHPVCRHQHRANGRIADALRRPAQMGSPEDRASVAVWTRRRSFPGAELLSQLAGHRHPYRVSGKSDP